MTVVTLLGYTPPPRFPPVTTPWTSVEWQEAPDAAGIPGAWTVIDTQLLDPVDANPEQPARRRLTTLAGTVVQGWYRVVWLDADGNRSEPTAAVRNVPPPAYRPSVDDVAALEHARTEAGGVEVGTFTDETIPTVDQVEELITTAVSDVETRVGTIPDRFADEARRLAAIQAASLIEASYFPSELDSDRSAYRQYTAMYMNGVDALAKRVASPGALRLV